jgi:hypothetical protein
MSIMHEITPGRAVAARLLRASAMPLLLTLAGCATMTGPAPLPETQERFWAALSSHCGQAYAGELVSGDARDTAWRGQEMVAHWAECSDRRIAIALHVQEPREARDGDGSGWNRSRTWVVTRTDSGLRLKHDHRHADGSEDAVTQYGGDTLSAGTARVQDFPVDAFSIAMFERGNMGVSTTNVWRIEADPAGAPGARVAYQLTRRNDPTRLFRLEFDATRAVAAPPAAWGW